jgi:DNA-binding NarL/FixJ family response regulator
MALEMTGPRLAVVSPYPALRAGLRSLLLAEGLEVVVEAADPTDLLGPLGDLDVAVLDLAADGLEALLDMLPEAPALRPLVLGPIPGAERLLARLDGRAWGYLPREAGAGALAQAARSLATGLLALDPGLAAGLLALPAPTRAPGESATPVEDLTPREREVLALMAEGLANKQIAQRLHISEHTVKFHVAAILAKLGAASRTEAGYVAARRGLIAL